jgi:hypothetical protein
MDFKRQRYFDFGSDFGADYYFKISIFKMSNSDIGYAEKMYLTQ